MIKLKDNLPVQVIVFVIFFCIQTIQSQEIPKIKYLERNTMDVVKIDYDNDGDLDFIIAGVFSIRYQGRVYLVENKGNKFNRPEYIYSYPTVPLKQKLNIEQLDDLVTIVTIGMSPTGDQLKYTGTVENGEFVGLLIPPIISEFKN